MEQDEDEQNYKKWPTPVVGRGPNGKVQIEQINPELPYLNVENENSQYTTGRPIDNRYKKPQ